jgi:hypothetical protein
MNGGGFNAGVFLIRRTPKGRAIASEWLAEFEKSRDRWRCLGEQTGARAPSRRLGGARRRRQANETRAATIEAAGTKQKPCASGKWECTLGSGKKCSWAGIDYEQGSFALSIMPKHKASIHVVPISTFNDMKGRCSGDIAHFYSFDKDACPWSSSVFPNGADVATGKPKMKMAARGR